MTDALGNKEVNEIEKLSEEICELVRGMCLSLQDLIEEQTLRRNDYNEQVEFLSELLTNIKSQRYLVNHIAVMP